MPRPAETLRRARNLIAAMPAAPVQIRVGSNAMCHSPGLWEWFQEARKREPKGWARSFLAAFTNGRLTPEQTEAIIKGRCTVSTDKSDPENPTLIITL